MTSGSGVETDNSALPSKLALRRHFLRAYHAGTRPLVFDACAGSSVIWRTLAQEFDVQYWGVDVKPRRGRLTIDSIRILQQPGWTFDVIDIDTYGSPWEHWAAMLPHVRKPTTVCLTWGNVWYGVAPGAIHKVLGLSFRVKPPAMLLAKAYRYALPYLLDQARQHGVRISEACEAPSAGSVRYFGLRLEPGAPNSGI